jgi:hypothetical protein
MGAINWSFASISRTITTIPEALREAPSIITLVAKKGRFPI